MDVGMTTTCWSSAESQGGEDLGDFEYNVVGGARQAGLSTSGAADLLGVFDAQSTVQTRENKQGAAVLWAKMPCWCHRSEENGETDLIW